MHEDIVFRKSKLTDLNAMKDLMDVQYNIKKPYEYYRWQYFNSYYPTISYSAFKHNRLVGMFNLQIRELNDGAKAGQVIDISVADNCRRQGVLTNLYKHVLSELKSIQQPLDLIFVLANHNGYLAVKNGFKFNLVNKIDMLMLDIEGKVDSKEFILSNKIISSQLVSFKYNTEYINWRFNEHPYNKYYFIDINDIPVRSIVKVFTDETDKNQYGDIVYFPPYDNNEGQLLVLLDRTINYFINKNIKKITTWALPHTQYYFFLKSFGFKDISQERYFCINIVNPEYSYLNNEEIWYLSQCDSEIY